MTCGQPGGGSVYAPVRLAVDAAGNAYVAGYFSGALVFGATILTTLPSAPGQGYDYDWFVAKLDPAGAPVWAVRGGTPGAPDQARDLCLDGQGHVFVAGVAQDGAQFGPWAVASPNGEPRLAVARLDAATGAWQWLAHGGANRNQAYGVAADGTGHVFVAGSVGDRSQWADFGTLTIRTTSGNEDALVARLDAATGAWQWVSLGGAPFGTVKAQALALDGGRVRVRQLQQFRARAVPADQPGGAARGQGHVRGQTRRGHRRLGLGPQRRWFWAGRQRPAAKPHR